jgi:RHS repeat-associated protein
MKKISNAVKQFRVGLLFLSLMLLPGLVQAAVFEENKLQIVITPDGFPIIWYNADKYKSAPYNLDLTYNSSLSSICAGVCSTDAINAGASFYRDFVVDQYITVTVYYDISGNVVGSYEVNNTPIIPPEEIIPVSSTSNKIGSLSGEISISPSGSANYSIPLGVAPGTNGMTPDIGVSYDSQSGNGLLGAGWSLSAMSVISRCPQNLELDSAITAVNFTSSDRYCFNGQRLVNVVGAYHGNGTEYRTEIDSQQKIFSYTSGGIVTHFKVFTKTGQEMEFGNTTDSRIERVAGSEVLSWALNKVTDTRTSNYQTFSYTEDNANGDFRLARIDYTGNTNKSISPFASVDFEYADRVDISSRYLQGQKYSVLKRLTHIKIHVGNTLIKDYKFFYDKNAVTNFSRLKAVQECIATSCKNPTLVNYQNGQVEQTTDVWNVANAWSTANRTDMTFTGDFNGDGLTDIASSVGAGDNRTYMKLSNGSGFDSQTWTHDAFFGNPDWNWSGDFNGDGVTDLASGHGSQAWMKLSTRTGFAIDHWNFHYGNNPEWTWIGDFNGDGRADIASAHNTNVWMNISTGTDFTKVIWNSGGFGENANTWVGDFNGDGLADIASKSGANVLMKISTGSGFTQQTWSGGTWGTTNKLGDFNADGLMDIASISGTSVYIKLSTGTGFATQTWTVPSSFVWTAGYIRAGDFNGDGKTDLISESGSTVHAAISNQDASNFNYASWPTNSQRGGYSWSSVVDLNGDGISDFYSATGADVYVNLSSGVFPDLMTSVTDGLSNTSSVTYKPETDTTIYTRDSDGAYPNIDLQTARMLVETKTTTDGLNGTTTTNYIYEGEKQNMRGRGSLGFRKTTSYNQRTKLLTEVDYEHSFIQTPANFPYIGMFKYEKQTQNNKVLSETTNTFGIQNSDKLLPVPYTSQKVSKGYDINGVLLSTSTTTSNIDEYSNLTDNTVVTTDGTDTFTTVTNNVYGLKTSTDWKLKGLVTESSVYKSGPQGTSPTVYQNFNYNVIGQLDNESGRVVESNGTISTGITKTYAYDDFGHITSTTITASDITVPRVVTTQYDSKGQFAESVTNEMGHTASTTYNAIFGVPLTKTDANGLLTTYQYNSWGELTDTYAPGGNTSHTDTSWCIINCTLTAINPSVSAQTAKFIVTTSVAGGTSSAEKYAPDSIAYFDKLGREIRKQSESFDGQTVLVDTAYDDLGRVVAVTQPYFVGATKHETTTEYDDLNRVKTLLEPGVNGVSTSSVVYNGFTATTSKTFFNPVTAVTATQTSSEEKNVIGQVLNTTDNDGNKLYYEYDAQGNQVKTKTPRLDPADATGQTVLPGQYNVVEIQPDVFGRKKVMIDPDMGNWSYNYNSTSKLISQIDADGQTTTMKYDRIGRMIKRTDSDGVETHWVYNDDLTNGNTPNTKAIGKLDAVYMLNASGVETYRQTTGFTSTLGLLDQTTTIIDGVSYTSNAGYDRFHRPETMSYPETQPSKRLELKYVYTNGVLNEVKSLDGATNYWNGLSRNAAGQIKSATLGDNILGLKDYDVAGRVNNIRYNVGLSSVSLYNADYQYDDLGNLVSRISTRQNSTALAEQYYYDTLNRLTRVDINGVIGAQTYSHDVLGNLRSKTGVAGYEYNSARPHAVSKANGVDYIYNDNGGVLSGGGKTVTWSSFNKPLSIANASASSVFSYGPGRARYKHVGTDFSDATQNSTTIYIGGSYEKVTKGDISTHKHYIKVGGETVAQFSVDVNDVTATRTEKTEFLLRDAQGSSVAMTDATGNVTGQLDYDAFGSRRPVLGDSVISSIINSMPRGYTGHEHLDKLGLIHMNGRVYDSELGRFLSADPFVQFAGNLQSYNRYSYVLNNPMSYTDPSGFKSWRKKLRRWGKNVSRGVGRAASLGLRINTVTGWAYTRPAKRLFLKYEWARVAVSVIAGVGDTFGGSGMFSAQFSAYMTDISGGSYAEIGTAAARSGATAWAFSQVNNYFEGIKWGSYTSTQMAAKILANGAVGGISADLGSGKFRDGFKTSVAMSLVQWAYSGMRQSTNKSSARSGNTLTDPETREIWTYAARPTVNSKGAPGMDESWFGTTIKEIDGTKNSWWDVGFIRKTANAISKSHDWGSSWSYNDMGNWVTHGEYIDTLFGVYNYATMIPATAFTAAAYVPISSIVINNNRDRR